MAFMLKPGQEAFEIVDGPDAGKNYKKNVHYDSIPETESHRFETLKADLPRAAKPEAEPVPEQELVYDPGPQARKKRSEINA